MDAREGLAIAENALSTLIRGDFERSTDGPRLTEARTCREIGLASARSGIYWVFAAVIESSESRTLRERRRSECS